jgi:hypothetical protein
LDAQEARITMAATRSAIVLIGFLTRFIGILRFVVKIAPFYHEGNAGGRRYELIFARTDYSASRREQKNDALPLPRALV